MLDLTRKLWKELSVLVFSLVLFILFSMRNCGNKQIIQQSKEIPPQIIKEEHEGLKREIVLTPTNDDIRGGTIDPHIIQRYIDRRNEQAEFGLSIILTTKTIHSAPDPINSPSISTESGNSANNGTIIISYGDGPRIPIQDLPARPDSVWWDSRSGKIGYDWYGYTFAPGVELGLNGKKGGLGIDFRGLFVGDWGGQLGVGYYGGKLSPNLSVGYNLRRIKLLSNTDVLVGVDWNKTVFVALRVELGRK